MKHPTNFRAWLAFVHDLSRRRARLGRRCTGCGSASISTSRSWPTWARTLVWILPLQAAIFVAFGLYRGLWRFASLLDLQRIVLAAGLGALLIPRRCS